MSGLIEMKTNPLKQEEMDEKLKDAQVFKTKWKIFGCQILIVAPPKISQAERQTCLNKTNEFLQHLSNVLNNMMQATVVAKPPAAPFPGGEKELVR